MSLRTEIKTADNNETIILEINVNIFNQWTRETSKETQSKFIRDVAEEQLLLEDPKAEVTVKVRSAADAVKRPSLVSETLINAPFGRVPDADEPVIPHIIMPGIEVRVVPHRSEHVESDTVEVINAEHAQSIPKSEESVAKLIIRVDTQGLPTYRTGDLASHARQAQEVPIKPEITVSNDNPRTANNGRHNRAQSFKSKPDAELDEDSVVSYAAQSEIKERESSSEDSDASSSQSDSEAGEHYLHRIEPESSDSEPERHMIHVESDVESYFGDDHSIEAESDVEAGSKPEPSYKPSTGKAQPDLIPEERYRSN